MSKSKNNGALPRLRFPEFESGESWRKTVLGDLVDIRSGYSPSQYNLGESYKYPFIKVEDLNNSDKYQCYSRVNSDSELGLIPDYSIIFPKRGAAILLNKVRINLKSVLMDTNLMAVTPNGNCLVEFLYYKILLDGLYKIADTSTIPQINNKHILPYDVFIPKQEEQQKIADCLSSVDELISAQKQKLETLKDHKKGLMQQLFPAEGEAVPKLRFPEFENKEEWSLKLFKKMYSLQVTNSLSRENLNYKEGLVKNIHYGDIHTKFSTLFDITKEDVPYINGSVPLHKIKPESYCQETDMVFADASEDIDDIGKSVEIVNLQDQKLLSGLHTLLARQINSDLIKGFGGHLFQSVSLRKQIQKEAQGAKVLGISAGRISTINVVFPKSKEEQQKIADCLSSLDDLISTQNQKIELLQAHKKGLMQQLFPAADEVNA